MLMFVEEMVGNSVWMVKYVKLKMAMGRAVGIGYIVKYASNDRRW